MGKSRDALGLVLSGLRGRLADGSIAPGALIGINDTAELYRTSVTPVREALARLAGEGLLTGTRRLGFFRPRLDAEELAELYTLHEVLLAGAVRLLGPAAMEAEEGDTSGSAEPLFRLICIRARNRPLARNRGLTAQALGVMATAETALFGDRNDETAALWRAARSEAGALQRGLAAWHERRRRHAHELLRTQVDVASASG